MEWFSLQNLDSLAPLQQQLGQAACIEKAMKFCNSLIALALYEFSHTVIILGIGKAMKF
jgi:hypothetical protein